MSFHNKLGMAIRFHHPGKETPPKYFDKSGICQWKSKKLHYKGNVHSRKYLILNGEYVSNLMGELRGIL